jgi:ABC-type lipoprotein release transport system permease subunit
MKNKLSAFKYIRNNKKTVGTLIVALTLSFVTMYVIHIMLAMMGESVKPIRLELPKKVSYISVSAKTFGVVAENYASEEEANAEYNRKYEELVEALKKEKGIEDAYLTQVLLSRYNVIFGGIGFEFPLMEPEMIPDFLRHMEALPKEGRLPMYDGEVMVDSNVAKNQNIKVGDWYMEDLWGRSFKVVGILRSNYRISVGTPKGYTNAGWYVVVLNDEKTTDMRKVLKDLGYTLTSGDRIIDGVSYKQYYEEEVATMENATSVIFLVIMIFLSISVLVAYVSYMRNRLNEYCLYSSIGYGRGNIYGMMMREMLIIMGIAIVVGFMLSTVASGVTREFIAGPKGLRSRAFYPGTYLEIISMYVLIMGMLQIPVIISINGVKTIDAIED